jgi:hypothetical protein
VSGKIVQIWLNDVLDIMESIRHSVLKSDASVLETGREFLIGKSAPTTNKISLMLILRNNVDLIIPRETIHQREDFTSGVIVDNMIDEGGRKVVFGTRFVDIPIINAYTNCALFIFSIRTRLETQSVRATG